MLESLYKDCLLNVDENSLLNVDEKKKETGILIELFLWAVTSNLPDMMDLLLLRGQDLLRKALIGEKASKLMIEIGEKHEMLDDTISEYKRNKQ